MLLFVGFTIACKDRPVEHPNIVWITSEDNSKHYLELFDKNGIKTPSIESLAENGLIFTHAFSNAAVCSAARSTLISGCYGSRVGSHYHRRQVKVPMPDSLKMFPAYLRDAGYYTTNNRKEDYNFYKPDGVWDESSKKASWRNRGEGQPFFHVFNTTSTHEGQLHFNTKRMNGNKTITNPEKVFVQPNHPNTELFKYTNAYYRDRIAYMDSIVGKVIEELKKDELFESTFIFYYGDHGGVLPGSKGYLYETGLHVPLVIYIPKKYEHMVDAKRGSKQNGFVSFVDFGATVLSLAGVEIPEEMDGVPFLGRNIKSKEVAARDETYSYADRFDEKYDMVRALRKGKYKYIRNYQPFNYDGLQNDYRYKQMAFKQWRDMYKSGELNKIQAAFFETRQPEQLFDVEADPYETNNLANNEQFAKIKIELRNKLTEREKNLPDLSFYPEHFLIKKAFDNPVKFGLEHKADINNYIDIANLSLSDFGNVKTKIESALNSNDPIARYWGVIVCSNFADKAAELTSVLKNIALTDTEIINKVRAAEFLAITQVESPVEIMTKALYECQDNTEALLVLNTMVLMGDINYNFQFKIEMANISKNILKDKLVKQRLVYLKSL